MGLFSGLPKLPPELMAMMANPQAMGEQVKAFYVTAKELLEAIDAHKNAGDVYAASLTKDAIPALELVIASEKVIREKAAAFRKEFEKLPSLDKVTK